VYVLFLGFIVRFEFGQLTKHYFIDPEWLNSVFSLLVAPRSSKSLVQPGFSKYIDKSPCTVLLGNIIEQFAHVICEM